MNLFDTFQLAKYKQIAVIGAGGKTTFLYEMERECLARQKKVALTTTTKIYKPTDKTILLSPTEHTTAKLFQSHSSIVFGCELANTNKLSAPPTDFFQYINQYADIVFIEADGSKHFPLKAPNDTEPVYTPFVDCVVAVIGLSAIGKSIAESCHRKELVCQILKQSPSHLITPSDIISLLLHEKGILKELATPIKIILNQADTKIERSYGAWIQSELSSLANQKQNIDILCTKYCKI